jgi:DEAD/DEAH box helicase domain-containing protein
VVGFNIVRFDYEVLKAYSSFDFSRIPTFDLLQEISRNMGFRVSLGHLAEKTLGASKAADGVQAVKWFRESQWEPLTEHCKTDVVLTRDLFYHALEKGHLLYCDRRERLLRLPTPWDLEEIIMHVRDVKSSVQAVKPGS